jgi:hypothetical protein
MYSSAAKATPAPTFNPNDYDSFGGKNASKPSPGFAPTSKGRFDAGPGSMYATATPQPKKTKPKPVDPLDEKAAEWSKALGLGAVAGAKAAPVLKGLDEMRAKAEAEAADALAAKEAAETTAAEAMRKAEWITKRAEQRVAEAETKLAAAEEALAHSREEHEMTREQLDELREAGLTGAIVHASKILPRNKITDEQWAANRLAALQANAERFMPEARASRAGPGTACRSHPSPHCPAVTPPAFLSPSEHGDPA